MLLESTLGVYILWGDNLAAYIHVSLTERACVFCLLTAAVSRKLVSTAAYRWEA